MNRARLTLALALAVPITVLILATACDIPRPTPSPTATALPPQPPKIIRWAPVRGQEQGLGEPIEITFDQPMDREAVTAAWVISPQVAGTFAWQDNTFSFMPSADGLARATSYRVTLSTEARSAVGLPLAEAFALDLHTIGYLEVASVHPAPGTKEVTADSLITVVFNRPVVPLTAVSQPGQLQPLQFSPPISGQGQWLNTSIYTFEATPGFRAGTTLKVTIAAEPLAQVTNAVLAEDYVWEFSTERPKVTEVSTSDPQSFIGPSPTISITFNMLMDHDSVEQRFALRPGRGERPVPVEFHWSERAMSIRPLLPLSLDTGYVATVAAGAHADIGGEGMEEDFTWSFRTIPSPSVVATQPLNGDREADPYSSLQVTFSSPINPDSLLPNLTILPEPTEVYTTWVQWDSEVYISFGAKPSTTYSFTFGSDIEGRFGHKLGEPYSISFTTRALSPSLYLPPGRLGTYDAYTTTAVYVQHVNVPQLTVSLYRLDRNDFVLLSGRDWWQHWEKFQPGEQQLIRGWTTRVSAKLNEYAATSVPLAADGEGALRPGFYYLEVRAPGVDEVQRHMLVVSHSNVTLKVTQNEALVWVTDLASGQPVPGLDVVILGSAGQVMAEGRTDNDGVLFAKLTSPQDHDPWAPVLVIAGADHSPAAASTNWADGISPWQFGLSSEPYVEPYRAYFYTDRAIYRPGQTVYFKGVLRADDDARYSLISDIDSVQVVVRDDQGKELYLADLALGDMSTLHGEFKLSDDASLGFYSLNAQVGERTFGTGFRVAEYRKPEFEVSVSTDKGEYIQGAEITAQVVGSYYFGGPVSDARVSWRLMTQDHYFAWPENTAVPPSRRRHYSFHDFDYDSRQEPTVYGELVTMGTGLTDADGTFTISLPADISTRKNSQIFTLEASITDPSNQEVSGRSSAIVHKGSFYVGLAPQEYVGTAGQENQVDVIALDPKGATVADVPMTIVFLELNWYNVQQQADDGRFYWTWELEETPVYTTSVTTDGQGNAVVGFTPEKGGSYRVRALARDEDENEIRSSAYLWISGNTYVSWRQENNDRIELVSDKQSYKPGETARVLIPSPFQGQVKALLTLERGHLYDHRVLTLSSNSDQVEIPILSAYAPNVYVSIVLVKGTDHNNVVPSYRVGYVNLDISTEEKELNVEILPDRSTFYQPGETATFGLRATDHQGQGVEAELSVQLVDLSIIALTNGARGAMLEHFCRGRGLGVRTGATLAISVDRYRQQAQPPSGKGGSGGLEAGDAIRKRFLDTAYWNAQVRTDSQGRASVTVDLPDNLTTWRATAQAVTADTLVGEGAADIVTSKDLLIRSVAPRFFVLGDEVQLGAVVHNNTAETLTVNVSLQGQGVLIEEGAQQIEIAANGEEAVQWQARVTAPGSAVLTWRAATTDLSDALQLTLPVYHYSTPELVATAGQVTRGESRVETLLLPERLDPTQGELTVQLDPSLAASMRDGLKYLEQYPYDCIEQTISRFLPNVITYRALKKLGISNAELEARLPQYVSVGLQRIYALQHYDGGWGWWLADNSNPFISAYVLMGMNEAKGAGFAVTGEVMDRAARYLLGTLEEPVGERRYQSNVRAFVLYVLAQYGHGDLGRAVALFEKRGTLDTYGKAFLLMALGILEPEQDARVNTLLSDLTNASILSATGAHWEEETVDYWTMNTNTRSTAIVLEALVRSDPRNPVTANAVRWLMTARKQGHWETTQETAWSIMALTDYMVATGELQANYDFQVSLNGKELGQGTVTTQDVDQTRRLVATIEDLVRDETNHIVLRRSAAQVQPLTETTPMAGLDQGQLYYSMYLRYYLPVEDVRGLNRGIVVSRQYSLLNAPNQPVDTATVGDVLRVKLTLIAPNDLHYLVVEDPLPAGSEALDISLKTTRTAYQEPEVTDPHGLPSGRAPYWSYFAESELHDEKIVLFATYLGKGTYEYTYLIRASVPGRFLTMPTQAYEMYFPEVYGRSDGAVFTIGQ
jgi:uncharacterized protein YfaS (alpha-2-macroglobulin family)